MSDIPTPNQPSEQQPLSAPSSAEQQSAEQPLNERQSNAPQSAEQQKNAPIKRLLVHSEVVYVLGVVLLALAVAMCAAADFGVSMIVAPAYILSLKISWLTFGRAEYVVQAVLFVLLCLVVKKIRVSYLFAFFTCIFYGAVLDLIRLIPFFSQEAAGQSSLYVRIPLFIGGMVLSSFAVCLSVKTYLPSQVYDFFVKKVSGRFSIPLSRFKTAFDTSFLLLAVLFSFLFFGFGSFVGVGIGTVVITLCNGFLIGLFGKLYDRFILSPPLFPRLSTAFD